MFVLIIGIARLSVRCTKVRASYCTRTICYPSIERWTGGVCKSEVSDLRRSHASGSTHTTRQADSSLASLPPAAHHEDAMGAADGPVAARHCKALFSEEFPGRSSESDCRRHS